MRLILEENSFKFHNRHFVQTRGIAVGTKMAVAFSIIYMADFEERLLRPAHTNLWYGRDSLTTLLPVAHS